jgi:hypothetical protein
MIAAQSSRVERATLPVTAGNLPAAPPLNPQPIQLRRWPLGQWRCHRQPVKPSLTLFKPQTEKSNQNPTGSNQKIVSEPLTFNFQPAPNGGVVPPAPQAPRPAPTAVNFNHSLENALTFKARPMPFHPPVSVHFSGHAISHPTHCESALCAISAKESALPSKAKTRRVSRCPSMARKVKQAKRPQKNSNFFPGHFDWKSLANQAKTAQRTLQNHSKNPRILCINHPIFNQMVAAALAATNKQIRNDLQPFSLWLIFK